MQSQSAQKKSPGAGRGTMPRLFRPPIASCDPKLPWVTSVTHCVGPDLRDVISRPSRTTSHPDPDADAEPHPAESMG